MKKTRLLYLLFVLANLFAFKTVAQSGVSDNSCFAINTKTINFGQAGVILFDTTSLIGKVRTEVETFLGKPNGEWINHSENTAGLHYRPQICKTNQTCGWQVEIMFQKELVVRTRIIYD